MLYMNKVSNYDEFDYDYKTYWDAREYEDEAEKIVLRGFFKNLKGNFYLDIGGSFGRNLQVYDNPNVTPIILDYSIKTLQKNRERILKQNAKTQLVAANAYHMPFKESSVDASMMIRVLHHIENQKGLFHEIKRITKPKGFFILEYANKMHLKARLRWILKLQFNNFSTLPYQQPSQGNFEGSQEGENAIFLNFHPRYIKKLLRESNFKVLKSTNCSFFRINFLKKNIPIPTLIALEKFSQKFLSWKNIAPSIIIKTIQEKDEGAKKKFKSFENILCCPKCKSDLSMKEDKAICNTCNKIFKKENEVWDFRI